MAERESYLVRQWGIATVDQVQKALEVSPKHLTSIAFGKFFMSPDR